MFNQNKPPGFALPQPEQQQNEWNVNNMPWASSNSQAGASSAVMQFSGIPVASPSLNIQPQQPTPGPSWSGNIRDPPPRLPRTKRRSESEDGVPAKHFITEEKMIAHLSTLRLNDSVPEDDIDLDDTDDEAEMEQTYPVNLTPQELEQRLKNASRITVIDSVRETLRQNPDSIIPPELLEQRMRDQQCKAVVLWQPPRNMVGYDPPAASSEEEDDDAGYYMDDNNNNNGEDPNNNGDVEDMDL